MEEIALQLIIQERETSRAVKTGVVERLSTQEFLLKLTVTPRFGELGDREEIEGETFYQEDPSERDSLSKVVEELDLSMVSREERFT